MQIVDLSQAQQELSQLIENAIAGDEIIITKSGQPIAKLVAIEKPENTRHLDSAKGLIKVSEDFDNPLEDFQEYM